VFSQGAGEAEAKDLHIFDTISLWLALNVAVILGWLRVKFE